MKTTTAFLLASAGALLAQGPLTPPGAPAPTMKTLVQIEPRIDVATLTGDATYTHRITSPGSYYLSGNITYGTSAGIGIEAPDVTLDLSGFYITGSGSGDAIFITAAADGASITNGVVRSNKNGISAATGATAVRLIGVRAVSCGVTGLQVRDGGLIENCEAFACGTGLRSDGSGSIIRNSRVTAGTGAGIRTNPACQILDSSVSNCTGNGLEFLQGTIVTGNHVSNCGGSGLLALGSNCHISGNTVQSNSIGIRTSSTACVIEDNTVFGHSGSPIFGGTSDHDLNFTTQAVKAIDVLLLPGDSAATGARLIDKPGRYFLSGPLNATQANGIIISSSNVHLDLRGQTITGSTSGGAAVVVSDGGFSGIHVTNGKLQGFTNSLYLISAQGCTFEKLSCASPLGIGVRLVDNSSSCRGNSFSDLSITNAGNNAIQLRSSQGFEVSANRFSRIRITAPTGAGILLNPASGKCAANQFSQITIANPTSHGVRTLDTVSASASSNTFEDISVVGSLASAFSINSDLNRLTRCSADAPTGSGFHLQSLASGNTMEDCTVRSSTSHAFHDQSAGESTYLRCTTLASGGDGFLVHGGGTTSATRILDSLIHGSAGYGIRCGFEESTFSGVAIERCNISATGNSGILLTDAGDGSGLNNRVIDCIVTGATGTGINLAASAIAERNQVHQTVGSVGSDFNLADGDIHFSRNHSFTFGTSITAFSVSSAGGSYGPFIVTGISGTGALLDTGPESHPSANFEH